MSDPSAEEAVSHWVEAYVRAWESNDPGEIGSLFTDDARYFTAPHREPWVGREAIVAGWLDRKDVPGTWQFRWNVLLTTPDGPSLVRGETDYDEEEDDYSNLWVIHLDEDGRCREFVEWWMVRD